MAENLPSVDPDRTILRDTTADPATVDATADTTSGRLTVAPGSPDVPGYRVLGEIARGGMGQVFAAYHLALDREVAIKTLLKGAKADRFVTESKITARLPHPGIPPVYELSQLADGTPFLAMKLIRGQTLSELLKARPTPSHDLPRFVQVFEQIAQAVGFAHSRGILHRDLKPLNVMVGEFGEVQVMDWGLAKDMANPSREDGGDATTPSNPHLTRHGEIMGTPGYMAPEQARAEPLDARADVFSLGSILASILTSKPAFVGATPMETIQKSAAADLADVLTRLDSCAGDADLIALAKRCLSADRDSRPADGQTVAAEVSAYRAGVETRLKQAETDRARAETRAAETRKRQRALLVAGGIIAAVLLAGVIGTSIGAVEAWRQTGVAREQEELAKAETAKKEQALDEKIEALAARSQALQEAETNLGYARKGNKILGSVFETLDPKAKYVEISDLRNALRDNLKKAVTELEGSAIGDPLAVAEMQTILGHSLLGLGEVDLAVTVFTKARDTLTARYGPDHPHTLSTMDNLATGYQAAGQMDRAVSLFEETLKLRKTKIGLDHSDTLTSMNNLAWCYREARQFDRALPLLEQTLKLTAAQRGPDHPDTLASMNNLAGGYLSIGQFDRALPMLEEVLRIRRANRGPDHPDTLASMNNLALCYRDAGRPDRALPLFEQTLKKLKAILGTDHLDTISTISNLASTYQFVGQPDRARPLLEEAFKLRTSKLGPNHLDTLHSMNELAMSYFVAGKLDLALPLLEEAHRGRSRMHGPDHVETLNVLGNLGAAYAAAKQGEKASTAFTAFVTGSRKRSPKDHPQFAGLLAHVSLELLKCDQYVTSEELFREALAIREKTQPDAWSTFNTQSMLGGSLLGQKRYADAEPLLLAGYEGMKQREKTIPPQAQARLPEALDRLVQLYEAIDKPDEAAKWRAERAKYPPAAAATENR